MSVRSKRWISMFLLTGVLSGSTGCKALGLEDWQRDILSAVASGVGAFLAGQSTRVVVERECFENGVRVECSSIPGG